jgi:hypothetical protein
VVGETGIVSNYVPNVPSTVTCSGNTKTYACIHAYSRSDCAVVTVWGVTDIDHIVFTYLRLG